jgi:zinc protease
MVQSGSAQDPDGAEGLSAFTVSLLEQGTALKPALQIADDFAQLGSSFTEAASSDYVLMTTAGLAEYKEKLLNLYSHVILNPAFSPSEVERRRSQILSDLTELPDQPTEFAGLMFDKELFGNHPYGHPVSGTIPSVQKITRSKIIKHYFAQYRPNNAILAITGNFDDKFVARVEKTFSQWHQAKVETPVVADPKPIEKMAVKLYSKSGLQQAQIRIGQFGIKRTDPDFLKLRLANIILGGAFASRLNQKIRDDLGLTYSINSQFDAKRGIGSFEISTFARNEKVAEAIKNTLAAVHNFQKEGVTSKELKSAKALLIGQFPAAIETVDRLAFNLLALRIYGVPDTYLTEFFTNVNSISLKEVNAAVQKYFSPEKMKIVIFADEKAVQSQMNQIGEFQVEKVE